LIGYSKKLKLQLCPVHNLFITTKILNLVAAKDQISSNGSSLQIKMKPLYPTSGDNAHPKNTRRSHQCESKTRRKWTKSTQAASAQKSIVSNSIASVSHEEGHAEKSVSVFAVQITQLIILAFTMLREWQTIEILDTSKESRLMFQEGNARVRSHPVTKTIASVLGPECSVVKIVSVWTAEMVNLTAILREKVPSGWRSSNTR
jgi:hypothetical protein